MVIGMATTKITITFPGEQLAGICALIASGPATNWRSADLGRLDPELRLMPV